jgi:peptidoglycan/xylan/chitin deacetylase (PgdA/CDA1 family)
MSRLRTIKLAALRVADRAGVFPLVAGSNWRRRRLLILCYHGVSLRDEHECSDEHVSPDHLRRRFQLIRDEGCTVLPLGEAVERLARGDLPSRSVALTFDDGLYDFKARAYPLLEEFGYHATVYVSTYYCLDPRPVFDVATAYLLWQGRGRMLSTVGLTADAESVRVPESPIARNRLARRIRDSAVSRGCSAQEKDELLRELCTRLSLDWEAFLATRIDQLMTPAELRSLDSRVAEVQLHTHRHRTPRDEALFGRELDDNIAALEQIGLPRYGLRHFCYPSGDVDPMFLPWLRDRGISTATTCEPRLATWRSDPLLLPRLIDTMGLTTTEFRAWLTGAAAIVPRRRR